MIVREREHDFVMIRQHDHAHLSGEMAKHLKREFFQSETFLHDVIFAIYEHDRSWIALDDTPVWDDRRQAPFSFMNYPLLPKMALYKAGLDEIEAMNPYAGLLCSLHYSSFFMHATQAECLVFLQKERARQRSIKKRLQPIGEETVEHHFRLLKLCDDLSLYVCLNEPGVKKQEEHPWYRKGIKWTPTVQAKSDALLTLSWMDERQIRVREFIFERNSQRN